LWCCSITIQYLQTATDTDSHNDNTVQSSRNQFSTRYRIAISAYSQVCSHSCFLPLCTQFITNNFSADSLVYLFTTTVANWCLADQCGCIYSYNRTVLYKHHITLVLMTTQYTLYPLYATTFWNDFFDVHKMCFVGIIPEFSHVQYYHYLKT